MIQSLDFEKERGRENREKGERKGLKVWDLGKATHVATQASDEGHLGGYRKRERERESLSECLVMWNQGGEKLARAYTFHRTYIYPLLLTIGLFVFFLSEFGPSLSFSLLFSLFFH